MARHRGRWRAWYGAVLVVPLVLGAQLHRGLAEGHHNLDAPLTIEAPWQILPCDLALSAYPAVLDDPLGESLAAARWAATAPLGALDPARARPLDLVRRAPDSPRAPPAV